MARRRNTNEEDGVVATEPESPGAVDAVLPEEEKVQPVHAIRLKNVRGAIWSNRTESGTFLNVTFSRSYRDQEGNWHTTESFGRDDLLLLAKIADLAHSWIWEQIQHGAGEIPF